MQSICHILFNKWRRLSRLSFIHVPLKLDICCAELLSNLVIFQGVGAFDPSGGDLNKNFRKIQMPRGCPGGMLKLRFDWYITLHLLILHICTLLHVSLITSHVTEKPLHGVAIKYVCVYACDPAPSFSSYVLLPAVKRFDKNVHLTSQEKF